jgi:Beta-ketoacyl synthase, C-terminal domain
MGERSLMLVCRRRGLYQDSIHSKIAWESPKAAVGHSMGAAGAVEAVLTVQALADDVVPPTLNLENLDPEIDLDVVAGKARHDHYRGAVTNSFGLAGITSLWRSARNDRVGFHFVRVNWPTSLMPRRKKSAHPVK